MTAKNRKPRRFLSEVALRLHRPPDALTSAVFLLVPRLRRNSERRRFIRSYELHHAANATPDAQPSASPLFCNSLRVTTLIYNVSTLPQRHITQRFARRSFPNCRRLRAFQIRTPPTGRPRSAASSYVLAPEPRTAGRDGRHARPRMRRLRVPTSIHGQLLSRRALTPRLRVRGRTWLASSHA